MPDRLVEIELELPRRFVVALLACSLVGFDAIELASELLTVSTPYPSASGSYARIVTTGGAAMDSLLNINAGRTAIGFSRVSDATDNARGEWQLAIGVPASGNYNPPTPWVGVSCTGANCGAYGARSLRFPPDAADHPDSGVIAYKGAGLDNAALGIVGAGVAGSRAIIMRDNVRVSGDVTATNIIMPNPPANMCHWVGYTNPPNPNALDVNSCPAGQTAVAWQWSGGGAGGASTTELVRDNGGAYLGAWTMGCVSWGSVCNCFNPYTGGTCCATNPYTGFPNSGPWNPYSGSCYYGTCSYCAATGYAGGGFVFFPTTGQKLCCKTPMF